MLCYPDQKIVEFIPGSNEEFTVEKYKDELGKPYSQVNLYLCNVSIVENADHDSIERNKVTNVNNELNPPLNSQPGNSEQEKQRQENSGIPPSRIVRVFQPTDTMQVQPQQESYNDSDFENIFPSLSFQTLSLPAASQDPYIPIYKIY